jgi:hypothetical protein
MSVSWKFIRSTKPKLLKFTGFPTETLSWVISSTKKEYKSDFKFHKETSKSDKIPSNEKKNATTSSSDSCILLLT